MAGEADKRVSDVVVVAAACTEDAGRTVELTGMEDQCYGDPTMPLGLSQESPRAAASNADCASGSNTLDSQCSLSHFDNELT